MKALILAVTLLASTTVFAAPPAQLDVQIQDACTVLQNTLANSKELCGLKGSAAQQAYQQYQQSQSTENMNKYKELEKVYVNCLDESYIACQAAFFNLGR